MNIAKYIQNSLANLDFTEGEAKLYFDILQADGNADSNYLMGINKYSTAGVYKILDSLIEKSFIMLNGKARPKKYLALSLNAIAKKMAVKGRKLNRIVAKFEELDKLTKIPVESEVYEEDDMTDYYLNIPNKIDDFIWCVGSFEAVVTFFGPEIEKEFIKQRSKKGKFADAIIFDNSEYSKDLAGRDALEKRETKIIAHNNYPLEFSYLFKDTVLDFYKDLEERIKVIKIDSPDVARARLIQYQQLWNSTST